MPEPLCARPEDSGLTQAVTALSHHKVEIIGGWH